MELPFEDWSKTLHSFNDLASIVQTTHDAAQSSAVKAINRMQTMRNWLIGYYIVEFEQHGKDRAEYGTQLLKKLEERVDRKGLTRNTFQSSRVFYRMYPQMIENFKNKNRPTVSCKSTEHAISPLLEGSSKPTDVICTTLSCKFVTPGETLVSKLSFSHINEIMKIDDPLARYFYEQECIKCTWSVRELRRQISTNLYVRAGISANPEKLLSLPSVQGHDSAELQIRQPFTFEFLGLKAQEVVDEHDLDLQPHSALRRNHRTEERGVLLRELRTAQRIRLTLSRERDATWRQPSYRHPALHTQRQKDGGVRARRHG